MACFNRNTQEYKDLLGNFNSNLKVDGIITGWQLANNSDKFPTVAEANLFLKNKKIAFNLKRRDFSDVLLSNLVNKRLISKYKDAYWVVNSNRASRVYDESVLQSNLSQIKRYLQINNIPVEALQFTRTRQSIKVAVDDSIFSPKDLLESSRSWDTNKSKHVIVHLMRLFPNLRIEMTTVAKAKAYYDSLPAWQKANVKFEKVNSYFDPVASKVFLVEGRVTDETAIEEILHPFTDALYIENRALFNSLLEEAKINFPVLKQQIENSYSDKLGFTKEDREFELVTQALSRYFKKEFEENPTKTFTERIKEFLEWFAGIINNLHKYITGINISSLRSSEVVQPSQTGTIKPGVEELFESNQEFSSQIYEALGFETKKINLDFEINTDEGITINTFYKGENLGGIDIQKKGNEYFVRNVKSNIENQGIGTEIYKKAIEYVTQQGGVLKPDLLSAPQAYSIYKKLEREGLFKITNVSEQLEDGRYEIKGQSTGKLPISEITPQQKKQALQLYSQYLDTIFPDSKVKDIVYHGSNQKIDSFNTDIISVTVDKFTAEEYARLSSTVTGGEEIIISALINVKNPKIISETITIKSYDNTALKLKKQNTNDALIANNVSDYAGNEKQIALFSKNQIHILGGKQDIDGFRKFVSQPPKIKKGVSELFDSNPELANAVYEALGFNQELAFIKSDNTIDDDFYIKDELIVTKELQNIRTTNWDGSINMELSKLKNKLNQLPIGSKFNISEYTKPTITSLEEVLNRVNLSESNRILLEKIKPLIKNVKIEYVDKFILSNSGAVYSNKYNTIRLNRSEKSIPLEELLMHELLHAATFRKISYFETNTKGLSKKELEALNELENIRKVLKEVSDKYWDNRPRFAMSVNPLEGYRTDSIHEIISYAFTNKEFRDAIAQIPYKQNKSILDRLVELIANIFGVNQDTVLSTLLANAEVLLESNQITPQQKQQAQQLYSQYLDSIFPNSKVKDIVYRGDKSKTINGVTQFLKGERKDLLFLSTNKEVAKNTLYHSDFSEFIYKKDEFGNLTMTTEYEPDESKGLVRGPKNFISAIVNIQNPLVKNAENQSYRDYKIDGKNEYETIKDAKEKIKNQENDSLIVENVLEGDGGTLPSTNIGLSKPEQIHILGSKQDVEGFKRFVSGGQGAQVLTELTTINLQDIKPTTTLSDIAKLLNTSDIKFDMKASANNKIRFSLTPELQSVVDFALSQSNETQSIIIKKLFHQAQELKDEVGSLSAGEDGPIVVLNEENHIYYNLLDTTEVFKSTTERIKGTFSEEDLFNKKLNLDLGNDFDKLLQAIASDKSFDDVFSSMKVLSKEQAGKAYVQLRENLNELTRGGGVAIPQVVVYDRVSRTAGTIDILIVLPNGKLKIVDLKTSKNSIREMAAGEKNLKYDTAYNLAIDSDLRKLGVEKLSTRSQQGLQVNIYRRMLENMGYDVDESDTGASTFHIQVGVSGKDADQKFTGEFRSDEWVLHPLSQNSLYVDLLVPKNKDLFNEEQIDSAVDKALSSTVNWNEALTEDEKAPENNEDYTEFEVITQALESYKIGLTKKLQAVDSIKSSIFMDRSKEETREDIANGLSLINLALSESTEGRSAIFTDLVRDAIRQMDKFIDYMQNPNNFNKPEYITYALNTSRFIKTFEGLHSVKDLKGFNNTQTRLVLELIARLNRVGANNNPNDENIIDTAITNYVKEQIKTWSSRDNLTEDILDDLIKGTAKEVRDIGTLELNAMDMATSRDIILAIMDKIYKVKKQEVLEKAEERNRLISELSSRLLKLSPGKNVQDIYDFMLEFDENGEFTGDYVKKIGRQYYDKLYELRDKLTDENGNFLEYRVIEDITTASKEDIEFNVKLAKIKAAYASFWSAERIGLDDKLMDGEYHSYTDEFKAIRAKYQYYVEVNGKPIWRKKASVSDRAYQIYLAKYFNSITYTYAVKDQNGNFTGATIPGREFLAPKPEYKIVNDYNKRTGESLLSKKYESIINPTDALGKAQKDFYLAFSNIYENELLNKLPPGVRSQMLGSVPVIKGKLFQDIKNKPNPVAKLWSSMTRSLKDLVSETTEQRGVVLDENGNIVDSLPVFYTGKLRNNEELEALNNEINDLNERLKKGLIKKLDYDEQIKILNARLIDVRSRPSKGELNKDMGTALMMFSTMAEHYEVMSGAEDTYRAFIKVLEKRQYQPSDKGTVLGTFTKGKFKAQGLISGADSNVLKRAKKWMSMVYYNSDDINKNFITKALDGLITYSSLSYVAFNPFGNFNNYALGRINNSIEALGGRFFSGSSYSRAEYEFNTQAIQSLIYRTSAATMKIGGKSDYDPKLPSNKYEALVDYFRMMDTKSDIRETVSGPQPIQKSYFSKFADLGYIFQDAAEYNVQTKTGMAILMDTMIMNSNTGDILSLYDAYEFDNSTKTVKLKNGYDKIVSLDPKNVDKNGKPNIIKESDFTDNYRYLIRNNIREVNKQIHGNYALDDRMVIQTHALGRLVAQFHKWVIPAINARFRSEYFDENLGWMEGRYRSFWKFLAYTTKKVATLQVEFGKHQENFMSEYGYVGDNSQSDQRAKDKLFGAYRTLGEIGFIMVSFALSSIFGSLFENDDEDDDTEFEKRMKNFLRYQTDRTYKELILFTPLGAKQVWQMFDSPIAATRTLGELGEALSLSVTTPIAYLIKGKEEFYLDKDYVYQRGIRKGELKLYKNWNDVIPILYSIKKWQDFNNLTNFYIK